MGKCANRSGKREVGGVFAAKPLAWTQFRQPRCAQQLTMALQKGQVFEWNSFHVVNDKSVEINHTSLSKLCSARDVIADAIIKEYPDPMRTCLTQ